MRKITEAEERTCRYIAMSWDAETCRRSSLRRTLPVRRAKTGTRPGLRGEGPQGARVHDQEMWRFPNVVLTEGEKREIVATVISLAVKELFSNHLYTFGGKAYRQGAGGPIGLRATCAIARIVMGIWDNLWRQKVESLNISLELFLRYMDDGRALLYPVRPGWRWEEGKIVYCSKWVVEDRKLTPTQRTLNIIKGSMQGIIKGLVMTMESKEMFDGNWLPTLDVSLAVSGSNRIQYRFFEKETTTSLTVQKRSAMEENPKVQIVSNEVIRRLLNTGREIPLKQKRGILDDFGGKLLASGYDTEQTRRIILGGIRGFESKVKRRELEGIPLYRTSEESGENRRRKKLVGKSSWFKGRGNKTNIGSKPTGRKDNPDRRGNTKRELKVRTVLFVEHTPGGELAKRLRGTVARLEGILGFRIKIIERTGTQVKDLFPLTNIWEGNTCGREDCVPCHQEGEESIPCTKRNLVYESICTKCNPGALKSGPTKDLSKMYPSVYVGETARSLYERSREHWDDYTNGGTDSHILKHHMVHHLGEGEPEMVFKVVKYHKTALSRQVGEAVRLRRRGEYVLNSKGEYNRCQIQRLTLNEGPEEQLDEGNNIVENEQGRVGEESLLRKSRGNTGRKNNLSIDLRTEGSPKKRKGDNAPQEPIKRNKKQKNELVGEGWGKNAKVEELNLDCEIQKTLVLKEGRSTPLESIPEQNTGGRDERGNTKMVPEKTVAAPLEKACLGKSIRVSDGGNSELGPPPLQVQAGLRSSPSPSDSNNYEDNGDTGERGNNVSSEINSVVKPVVRSGQCLVVKRRCTVHEVNAILKIESRSVWTKIEKTGLFDWRVRKSRKWVCKFENTWSHETSDVSKAN